MGSQQPAGAWGATGEQAREYLEPDFLALPHGALADAALSTATARGASHADIRVSRQRARQVTTRDGRGESAETDVSTGVGVRVLVDGAWGFAAGQILTPESCAQLAERAVAMARLCRPLASERVELADEPVHRDQMWASPYLQDPFEVAQQDVQGLLAQRSSVLLAAATVAHVDGAFHASRDLTHYADTGGTVTTNQRTRVHSQLTAWHVGDTEFEDMSTMAPPSARGWEYVATDEAWDWTEECLRLGEHLAEKVAAPGVTPGRYDLLIDPTNLWLTIHESIGHATELDRALGYEANYAGTSFATLDQLGTLQYGSPLLNVRGDRLAPHALASTGFDDEGVASQEWDLIRGGVLVGYQLDRRMAAEHGFGRSNGCAFADSAAHIPIQRMPNVSVLADPHGPHLAQMISEIDHGILILGDKSWSIDMARYNFQFTGQRFHEIRGGRIVGQLRDVAYQARTPDFWGSLSRVGGPDTYLLGGALNCGKGQPGQVAAVSHGAPACRFAGVNVLNATMESR